MQPNGMIFWDWNGTLMDDVDFTHSCLNWMLETHGYPQRYDLAAYRELFGFPIEDYYRCAGFDFARHPYPELAARFGFAPVVSREAFMGGMRAVIRSKNILIDNSFATLLREAKEEFVFAGGMTDE